MAVACDATSGSTDGASDNGIFSSGTEGSGGLGLSSSNSGGGGPVCNDPQCIGNSPQGMCDTGLPINGDGPEGAMDGSRAMGLCQVATGDSWGVLTAEWVRGDGQPLDGVHSRGKGILDHFGNAISPREGTAMLVLSSGSARNPGEPDYMDPRGDWRDMTQHGAPPGYPKEAPACPGVTTGPPYDSAGLRLRIRTPADALSFNFELNFYTYEYPDFICDLYNDYFVAILSPTAAGLPDGNISFDQNGNTISVNAGFLQACNPCSTLPFACGLGYGEIIGTGFDSNMMAGLLANCPFIQGSASTSWLVTTAPVEEPGGEIELHFAIWDSEDGVLDSTVLIDNFRFELTEGEVGTVPIPK